MKLLHPVRDFRVTKTIISSLPYFLSGRKCNALSPTAPEDDNYYNRPHVYVCVCIV